MDAVYYIYGIQVSLRLVTSVRSHIVMPLSPYVYENFGLSLYQYMMLPQEWRKYVIYVQFTGWSQDMDGQSYQFEIWYSIAYTSPNII